MSKKLYILPFDHRGSFMKMFGVDRETLDGTQIVMLEDYKHVIYEGFLKSLEMGISKKDGAILVEEQFGSKIHEEAREAGITRILTTEKSGQKEFDFEYGAKFREHIEKFEPEYVKALVRYNPEGDSEMNKRQSDRLKILNDFCAGSKCKFLFELLAVPTEEQKQIKDYDSKLRFEVMRGSIAELQSRGVEPDIWKIEGLDSKEQMRSVVEQAEKQSNSPGIVLLGRGESDEKVEKWIEAAAPLKSVIGLAVGRTIFKQPLLDRHAKKISREETAQKIAENFKKFVDVFEEARREA